MGNFPTDDWLTDFYRGASTAHLIAYAEALEQEYAQAFRDGPEREEYVARRYGLVLEELAARGVPFKGRLFPVDGEVVK